MPELKRNGEGAIRSGGRVIDASLPLRWIDVVPCKEWGEFPISCWASSR